MTAAALTVAGLAVVLPPMFTILGGDGKEYGPVTAEQIRAWIAGGRANLDTKAKVVGSTEDWKRLGDLPEFTAPSELPPPIASAPTSTFVSAAVTPVSFGVAHEPVDRGMRLLAVILDFFIALACATPGLLLLGTSFVQAMVMASQGQEPDLSNFDTGRMLLGISLVGFAILALIVVQLVMISTRGQTIAKRILGLRIVRHRTGELPGFVHGVLLRGFVPGIIGMVPMVGPVFSIVDACFIFRDDRRCIHDLMADTIVVKV